MLAKKFALGFGIAIVLPMVVHYGVRSFSPMPKWEDYQVKDYWQSYKDASPEEKARLQKEQDMLSQRRKRDLTRFQRHLFFTATPIGIIAIIVGSVISIQALGTGLMFGGIFTLIDGYCWYWSELQDWMRFLSLLVAFIILVVIGYRKLAK